MTRANFIADLRARKPEGVVLTDEANGRYNDYVLITPVEWDAIVDTVEAAKAADDTLAVLDTNGYGTRLHVALVCLSKAIAKGAA
jgi:hypothetical protein